MKKPRWVLLAGLLLVPLAFGISLAQSGGEATPEASSRLGPDELDELVAPIALYPDEMVALVLAASTQPFELMEATRYFATVKGDVPEKVDVDWDDSVKELLYYPDILQFFPRQFTGIEQGRPGNDGGAVLVVVKHGNVHRFFQCLLDLETLGSLDIFQIDAAERGLHQLNSPDHLLRVFRLQFDIENVNVGEPFKENPFPFHNRLSGHGADVSQSEDCGSVSNDCDKVTLCRVLVNVSRILLDFETGFGYARSIRK